MNGPALKPPPGVKPDFSEFTSRNSLAHGVFSASIVVSTILVGLQIYSRVKCYRKFAIEEGIAVAALGCFAIFVYYLWKINNTVGIFTHQWNLQLKTMPTFLYNVSAASATYGVVIMLIKAGILLHWARVFVPAGIHNKFWWTCHIILWINAVFYTITVIIEIFGCTPRHKIWTPWVPGKCLDMAEVILASSFVNFFSDLIILLVPQMVVWKLQLPLRKKLGIAGLFAMGLFATVGAGFRMKSAFAFAKDPDMSYTISELGLWCFAEMVPGFFLLSLPCLPILFKTSPLLQRTFVAIRSLTGRSKNSSRERPTRTSSALRARIKPRRDPDADLFTDTHRSSRTFIPLTDVETSKSGMER
ncbi:hypothetical protein DM02DRAFT_586241 [Periconia macrospinosa]|uniref:Rhodopsin domain-containing protein n=1 Tax=Periconia macrospinosa TaxID=97972 RepID=A0A2V1E3R3_9PLEO|nr:hypothetical protein DM02DRAFT_586241 [Periconia macrospinosa]